MDKNQTAQTPLQLMLTELKSKLQKALGKNLEICPLDLKLSDHTLAFNGPIYYISEPIKKKFLFFIPFTDYKHYFSIELGLDGKGGQKKVSCWSLDAAVREIALIEVQKYASEIKASRVELS